MKKNITKNKLIIAHVENSFGKSYNYVTRSELCSATDAAMKGEISQSKFPVRDSINNINGTSS